MIPIWYGRSPAWVCHTSCGDGGSVEQLQMKEDLTALRQRVVSELAAIDVVVWPRRKRSRRERLTRFMLHRARKVRRTIL